MMNGMNGYENGYENGFEKQHLDEDAFGAKSGSIVSAFDAFRKSCVPPSRYGYRIR